MAEMTPEELAEAGAGMTGDYPELEDTLIEGLQAIARSPQKVPRGIYAFGLVRWVIRAAVQAEREECAKIAEDYANSRKGDGIETQRAIAADQIAAAIRARGKDDERDIHEERMDAYQFGKQDPA